jgi:hypothetical protein
LNQIDLAAVVEFVVLAGDGLVELDALSHDAPLVVGLVEAVIVLASDPDDLAFVVFQVLLHRLGPLVLRVDGHEDKLDLVGPVAECSLNLLEFLEVRGTHIRAAHVAKEDHRQGVRLALEAVGLGVVVQTDERRRSARRGVVNAAQCLRGLLFVRCNGGRG